MCICCIIAPELNQYEHNLFTINSYITKTYINLGRRHHRCGFSLLKPGRAGWARKLYTATPPSLWICAGAVLYYIVYMCSCLLSLLVACTVSAVNPILSARHVKVCSSSLSSVTAAPLVVENMGLCFGFSTELRTLLLIFFHSQL